MKKDFTEIEKIIDARITELSEEYELDRWDIKDIRLEAYNENGWSYDPFPEEEEEEKEWWERDEEYHYLSMEQKLNEVGMSSRDFF